ncbi:hypothetical protein N9M18_02245 [Candidatus Pseudothioglobus singularis]|nr:hypothetical protein [Candidatus Pseudothioglobus singularis]|tara:strand:+ start:64 stop:351 length:288 start_codon:yes stop_codon:yes gene_type:complete
MKTIPIFILKSAIVIFLFFVGLQAYLPEKTMFLMGETVKQGLTALDRQSVQRQLIGSLSSEYAIDQKIILLKQQNNLSMIEFAENHKRSINSQKD